MDHIGPCLDSLYRQEYANAEVIVVDNASTDGMADFLAQRHPSVSLIRSERNLAYAGGNNLGASRARGSYLLFLNHDTLVSDGFLSTLVTVMESCPDIAIAQSRIMMAADPNRVDSVGAYLTRSGMWVHPMHGEPFQANLKEPADILGACGACLMVRRDLFEQLGGFDPDFTIYFEDADLCLRARLSGRRVVVVPTSVILHWGGVTTRKMPSDFTIFHSFKNRLCLLIKVLSPTDLMLSLPVHVSLCLLGASAYGLRLKPRAALAIVSALLWNLRNIRATLRKRAAARQSLGPALPGYRDLMKPLSISYLVRTSLSYMSRW
jgi:GT2 family glycosyltransferase